MEVLVAEVLEKLLEEVVIHLQLIPLKEMMAELVTDHQQITLRLEAVVQVQLEQMFQDLMLVVMEVQV